jgi:hypothetical protein
MTLPLHLWLEPLSPGTDLDAGLRAAVADPVWFLTRQWQLGEHQGEDASSPMAVRTEVSHVPVRYDATRPELDPASRPAEALVEAEPGDWWTIGRRVRLGRAFAALPHGLSAAELDDLRFGALPEPYTYLASELDGGQIHAAGLMAGDPIWNEVPDSPGDCWSPRELAYGAQFDAAGVQLELRDHDGGDVDWFSVDGPGGSPPPEPAPAEDPPARTVVPGRLSYPGAPNPRWWQIEDHHVDIGGFAPDRSHLGSLLLLDVVLAHSDDWFWFPVPPPAGNPPPPSSGVVATIHSATVRDSFDDPWELQPPPDPELEREPGDPAPWSLFRVAGLSNRSLVIWPVAVAPHAGPLLDDVVLGIDEDANVAWAVEMRADGLVLLDDTASAAAAAEGTPTGTRRFDYKPSTTLPLHWHPYSRIDSDDPTRPWVQGLVADLTGPEPEPREGPTSRLIGGPSEPRGFGDGHEVDGRAIPSTGVRLQRRARLARQSDGRPVLWVERRAVPILGPPASQLRFDVLAERSAPEP